MHRILYIYCGTCPTSNPDGDCTTFLGSRQLWSDNLFTGLNLWFRKLWRNPKNTEKTEWCPFTCSKAHTQAIQKNFPIRPTSHLCFSRFKPKCTHRPDTVKTLCGATNSPLGLKIIANPVGNCFDNESTHHFYTKRIIDGIDRCVCGKKNARRSTHSTTHPLHVITPTLNNAWLYRWNYHIRLVTDSMKIPFSFPLPTNY